MKQKQIIAQSAFRFKHFSRKTYSAFNSLNRIVNIGVITGCMLAFAHATQTTAQTASSSVVPVILPEENELEEVLVTASRVTLPLGQSAKQVTIITQDELRRLPVQSIQDLLNYVTGIDLLQRSGHGVQADVSIRGGSFDQTAILLNGINLSNPQTGHFSFDVPINPNDIERIEIIHGPSSLVYGASAFSGGINIITRKKNKEKAYGKIQAGGHELFGLEAGGSVQAGISTHQLSAGYNQSAGYRENTDYKIFNSLWQTHIQSETSTLDIQAGYNAKKYGANAFYTPAYPNQYEETGAYFASVKGETGEKLKFIPSVYWNRHNDSFHLFRPNTPNIPSWYTAPNNHQTDVYGANLNLQYESVAGLTSFGSEFRNEGVLSSVLGKEMQTPEGRYTRSDNRTNISYALEHTLLLKRFTFTAGVMANYNTALQKKYRFYPSMNASYRLNNNFKLYTSWSQATRMPTFTDLYYNTATHTGNPNLKPEYSTAYEIGLNYRNRFLSGQLTAYSMQGDNLIDWIQTNPNEKWQSVNLASMDKKGLEVNLKLYLNEWIKELYPSTSIQLGYMKLHQEGENVSGEVNSNYVLNYLRDKFTAQLTLPVYKDILTTNWNFRWQKRMGHYAKYAIETKTSHLEPYPTFSIMDFRLDYKINKNLSINLSINNLYNTYYFDLGNLPQAGFWMMGGVGYRIQ